MYTEFYDIQSFIFTFFELYFLLRVYFYLVKKFPNFFLFRLLKKDSISAYLTFCYHCVGFWFALVLFLSPDSFFDILVGLFGLSVMLYDFFIEISGGNRI